jgi:iron complex outermembrane receptor protein
MMTGSMVLTRLGRNTGFHATVSLLAIALAGSAAQAQTAPPQDAPALAPAAAEAQQNSGTAAPSGDQGQAVDTSPTTPSAGDDIVVTGVRASLQSAQNIKRNSAQIVDSIVAEDIGKLPDRNIAEALQRISGVQIQRAFGEGSSVAIRGLTQVRTAATSSPRADRAMR